MIAKPRVGACRAKVEGAWLITANGSGGPCLRSSKRYSQTTGTREIAAGRDRHYDRYHRQPIKGARRYDKHGPAVLLLVTLVGSSKSHRARLQQFAAGRPSVEPLIFLLRRLGGGIALCQQLIERIAAPRSRLRDHDRRRQSSLP